MTFQNRLAINCFWFLKLINSLIPSCLKVGYSKKKAWTQPNWLPITTKALQCNNDPRNCWKPDGNSQLLFSRWKNNPSRMGTLKLKKNKRKTKKATTKLKLNPPYKINLNNNRKRNLKWSNDKSITRIKNKRWRLNTDFHLRLWC